MKAKDLCDRFLEQLPEIMRQINTDIQAIYDGDPAAKTKTEVIKSSTGKETTKEVDYTENHFYLALSEFPFPHAIVKKGSFTDLDLEDVDVKAATFTFNADENKISFLKTVTLTDEMLSKSMTLSGTFDVLVLSDTDLVIKQDSLLPGVTVTYSYKKQK